jgi:hypothetical protein
MNFNEMADKFSGPLINKAILHGLIREVVSTVISETLTIVDGVVMPYGSVEGGEMKVLIYRAITKFAQDAKTSVT